MINFVFRNGVLGAKYLPLKIAFNKTTKRLHPEPVKNARWISVCGKEDKQCEKKCKNSVKLKRVLNIH